MESFILSGLLIIIDSNRWSSAVQLQTSWRAKNATAAMVEISTASNTSVLTTERAPSAFYFFALFLPFSELSLGFVKKSKQRQNAGRPVICLIMQNDGHAELSCLDY